MKEYGGSAVDENAIVPLENLKLYCGILRTGEERFGGTLIERF
jgi:hypothetical protein